MSVNNVIDETQLPAWMKLAKRGVDWGAILVIGFCVIASWSFIEQSELLASNDSEAYVYRISDYADAFEEGIFYSRWSPHAVNGYGAAIPHFYPSGAPYAGGLISYLFTNDPIMAVRALYVFSLIIAGSMTYTFVAQRTTSLAGIMSALLYVFSPYVMVTVSHIEGDLPLAIGTALLPSLMWAVNRLIKRYQALDFMLIAIIVALTIFTVPIMLLQAVIALLVLLIVEFGDEPDWKKLGLIAGAILTGILMSAFYWLPALIQYKAVIWHDSLFNSPSYLVTFRNLFALLPPIDAGLTNRISNYTIGAGLLLAIVINIPFMLFSKNGREFSLFFFILGFALLIIVLLFIPEKSTWLVLIIFCFSIAGSYIGQRIKISRIHAILIAGITIFMLMIISPVWVIPQPQLPIGDISPASQVSYEQSGLGYAGLPSGLPLPSNLSPADALEIPLSSFYDENISRLNNTRIFSPLIAESAYIGQYTITSADSVSLTYNRAYFDSWQATTREDNLTLSETPNHLISINIPANTDGDVTIQQGLTPLTQVAWLISLIAFGICFALWWYRWQGSEHNYDESILLPSRTAKLFALLLLGLGIARGIAPILLSRLLTPQAGYSIDKQGLYVRTNFARTFQLLAYDLPDKIYSEGDTVELTVFWTLTREVDTQYLVQMRVTDNLQRNVIYESGYSHPGFFPTNRWETSSILTQKYIFKLPDNVQQGNHIIQFDIYVCETVCSSDIMQTQAPSGQIRISRPLRID